MSPERVGGAEAAGAGHRVHGQGAGGLGIAVFGTLVSGGFTEGMRASLASVRPCSC
ncbi:hypothetical protein [Streptomyces deserti]